MGKHRVLVLGDEGVALFLTNGKKIERECSLPWLVPNFEDELITVLKGKNKAAPVYILYDALEQQYRKEDIVKTNIMDQQKLVKRKLASLFPNVLAYAHIALKPNKKEKKVKRKHNSYLIAAIPATEHMKRLQYVLTEARVDISGLALLPVESSSFSNTFLKRMAKKQGKGKDATFSRWTLMISHHETGGLRQIFTKDGTLALTRLTPLSDNSSENVNWAEEVYREFTGTMSYISRFGFNPNDGLDIIVICNEQNKQLLKTYDFKGANLHFFTIDEAQDLFDFKYSSKRKNPTDQYADLLHAGWLARQRRKKMPFKIEWIQKIAIPRRAARSAAALMMLGLLALLGLNGHTWQQHALLQDEIVGKEHQKTVFEEEYEQEAKIFDTLEVRPQTIRTTLELRDLMDKKSIYSTPIYQKIHSILKNKAILLELRYVDQRTPDDEFRNEKKPVTFGLRGVGTQKPKELFVTVRFRLHGNETVQQKIKQVEAIKTSFEQFFPGFDVDITKQYGNRAQTAGDTITGIMNQNDGPAVPQQQQAIPLQDNHAEISISGAAL